MNHPEALVLLLFMLLLSGSGNAAVSNIRTVIPGGEVRMQGRLTAGACIVSTDSRDLHVDMGQYTTHLFERVGDLTAPGIPFTIRLTDCSPGATGGVVITFSGSTTPKEPDVFRVTSSEASPLGVSGRGDASGLGLLISDSLGNQIIPDNPLVLFHPANGSDMTLHYIARYRASLRSVYPAELSSEVRFDIAYP